MRSQATRHQALADAEGIIILFQRCAGSAARQSLPHGLTKGELGKAAALIKASEVSGAAKKSISNNPRPFLIQGNTIHLVPDDVVIKDNQPYTADGGSFPSGHTNTGYTDALLMAEMIPERFDALVTCGALRLFPHRAWRTLPAGCDGFADGGAANVAHYLNDAKYRALFNEARDQLRTALEKSTRPHWPSARSRPKR